MAGLALIISTEATRRIGSMANKETTAYLAARARTRFGVELGMTACQVIRPTIAAQLVMAFAARQGIVPQSTAQVVIVRPTPKRVLARAAKKAVVSLLAIDPIRRVASVEIIRAKPTKDRVLPGPRRHDVSPVACQNQIIAGQTIDQIRPGLPLYFVIQRSAR